MGPNELLHTLEDHLDYEELDNEADKDENVSIQSDESLVVRHKTDCLSVDNDVGNCEDRVNDESLDYSVDEDTHFRKEGEKGVEASDYNEVYYHCSQ